MNGILLINKPKNMTSRDVVNQVSKIYQTKKVGHTGTLDPMATGVLILCLGTYTKLVEELTSSSKTYQASMKLGIETDTLDITGKVTNKKAVNVSLLKIKEVFSSFPKEYMQEVPLYSAVKINGKKLYEYVREGIEITPPKKKVAIFDLSFERLEGDTIYFSTTVSKGTYIRSLIRDLAKELDTVATMCSLKRTKQGTFSLDCCLELEDITKETPLLTVEEVFSSPKYELTENQYSLVSNGNKLMIHSREPRLFLTYQGKILAIYEREEVFYRLVFKVI